jgi:hypothetical protein
LVTVAKGIPRISLKGSVQSIPAPLGEQARLFAGGGGGFQDEGLAIFPISFQMTLTSDPYVYPGKGSKLNWTLVPTKSRQTLDTAVGALGSPM